MRQALTLWSLRWAACAVLVVPDTRREDAWSARLARKRRCVAAGVGGYYLYHAPRPRRDFSDRFDAELNAPPQHSPIF